MHVTVPQKLVVSILVNIAIRQRQIVNKVPLRMSTLI